MDLVKKQIQAYQAGKKIVNQFMVDEDCNVPDAKRDVKRILGSEAEVRIESMQVVEHYVRVCGSVYFQVLYVAEGSEPMLDSLQGKLSFQERVYVEPENGQKFAVSDTRVDFHANMIHSRKLSVKAMVELEVRPELFINEELTTDVISDAPLYKKTKNLELLTLHTVKKDTYRIKEELVLPASKEAFGSILWEDVSLRKLDTRLEEDALLIHGEILVFCFYESPEGKLDWITQTLPYEGRVDCHGVREGMYHHFDVKLGDTNVEIRLDEDGESRVLGVEATMEFHLVVYEEEREEILEDVYSPNYECQITTKKTHYEELMLQNHSKCKIVENLSVPELKDDILQICHCDGVIQMEQMEWTKEGIQVEGVLHLQFLYVKANDEVPFDTWQGMVPFSYLIECPKEAENVRFDITSSIEQLNVGLLGGDGVEIKAVLVFRSFIRKVVEANAMTELALEEISSEEQMSRPGMVGYMVKEGDSLWDIAKRFKTSISCICESNELKEEKIKQGDKLLIFKENISIL